jgi:hypothetical protein
MLTEVIQDVHVILQSLGDVNDRISLIHDVAAHCQPIWPKCRLCTVEYLIALSEITVPEMKHD